jgi:hypothetical protein
LSSYCRGRGREPDVPASVSSPGRTQAREDNFYDEDSSNGKGKSLLQEPLTFDGSKEKYEGWHQKVFTYINDPRN